MRYQNNPILGEMLVRGGAAHHLAAPEFALDQEAFANCKAEVEQQHPEHSPEEIEARAVYRMLTLGNPPPAVAQPVIEPLPSRRQRLVSWLKVWGPKAWPWIKLLWALAVLGLLIATAAKAEPHNVAEKDALVRAALRSPVFAQASGIIIQLQNQGSVLATRPAGLLVFNCSTNMSCSFSGSTFTITSSSTGSTAWSAITAGTNSNAGTFAASGNTWDFTAASLLKLRVGAGLTTSANGDIGQNSTDGVWHIFENAADRLVIGATNKGTAGQALLSNADGTATFADPQVTGNVASGVADSGNPVKTGYVFNSTQPTVTTGQRVDAQGTARGAAIVATGVDTFHVTVDSAPTTTVTGTVTANAGSGTFTVGGTVTANAGTGNFNNASVGSTGAAAPGSATQSGCAFNSTLPTLTTGQIGAEQCDSSARKILVGAGTAGTPAGGVVSVQGVASGTAVPVSGTVTANAGTGNFNNASVGATGSAVPASATYAGGNGSGNLKGIINCDNWTPFSLTANTRIITGAASKQTYICSINLLVSAADNVALVEGTGTTCATGTAGMAGGATAATGWNLAANGGLAQGSGLGAIMRTATAADDVCLVVSGTAQVSGAVSWTQF
jgi:hypothetical protein